MSKTEEEAVKALNDTKPPATDRFTYLALIEQSLTPELLPHLNDILQDAELTQEIGWDLVDKLLPLAGSEECLETIARLGNPREVILKVLEVLEIRVGGNEPEADEPADEQAEDEEQVARVAGEQTQPQQFHVSPSIIRSFNTSLGMLAILHQRIKTRKPSRFLFNTLATVRRAYRPNPEMTAACINLVQSLSGTKRPPLPTRRSSTNVINLDRDGDAARNAPDPEAEDTEAEGEKTLQQKLLLVFVTSILESFVNANEMEWARRLEEFYNPEKINPRKRTALQAFREDETLLGRDATVGKLAALASDLGLSTCSPELLREVCEGPIREDSFTDIDDVSSPEGISPSTHSIIDMLAYWVFSTEIFEASHPHPDMHLLPGHAAMLKTFLDERMAAILASARGTAESVIVLGQWLQHSGRALTFPDKTEFMPYLHQITLCAVFHPSLYVRNAAVSLAGFVLHADPDDHDRLKILEDLFENCVFSALQACAVTWLRDELVEAAKATSAGDEQSVFATSDCIEELQYSLFPDLTFLKAQAADTNVLVEYWAENNPFVIQAVNFAYTLLSSKQYNHLVPSGFAASLEHRYVEPLLALATALKPAMQEQGMQRVVLDLDILEDGLKRLPLH